MKHRPLTPGITFTQPCQGLWLVDIHGSRVGTVEGNSVDGFTVRDIDYHFIGRNNVSAKAAMQAWAAAFGVPAGLFRPRQGVEITGKDFFGETGDGVRESSAPTPRITL